MFPQSSARLRLFVRWLAQSAPKTIRQKRFVDWKRLRLAGGNGGDGCVSFHRAAHVPRGGPNGGNGGNGGSVYLKASLAMRDFGHVTRPQYQAERGHHGKGDNRHGRNGRDVTLTVPVGTLVRNVEGDEILGDLVKNGMLLCCGRGGSGGRGNLSYVSSTNRAPRQYTEGKKGEERWIELELKTIADIGLVGFPNAGKSTLLRLISNARPRVAAYPFTTLNPYVGIVEYNDHNQTQIAVADIPGLVRGAHENVGLGHSFLKHIERCHALLYVIDVSQSHAWQQLDDLSHELEQYLRGLSTRPSAIVANKVDINGAEHNVARLREKTKLAVCPVSALFGNNVKKLKETLWELYTKAVTTNCNI